MAGKTFGPRRLTADVNSALSIEKSLLNRKLAIVEILIIKDISHCSVHNLLVLLSDTRSEKAECITQI